MPTDCSNCNTGVKVSVSQCRSCGCTYTCDASGCSQSSCASANNKEITQKRIWNRVRVSQSEYIMNKAGLSVYERPYYIHGQGELNWNQMSDRPLPSQVKRNVPTRGNSTKSSITRNRPGSQSAPGKGVDVKHGSYHRYLARLKGKGPLRTGVTPYSLEPKQGNKVKSYGIVSSSNKVGSCLCFT
tara:strand:+ start:20812 stop:21366 length:555 start_codon:yes stop_codon:yes gene_type:complete